MKKCGIIFVILLSSFNNINCLNKDQRQLYFEENHENNLNNYSDLVTIQPIILKRIIRQTGYNYDKPRIPFDLPTKSTGTPIPVTPKPAPSPQPIELGGNYNYPSPPSARAPPSIPAPPSAPAPPISAPRGYDISGPKANQGVSFNESPFMEVVVTSGYTVGKPSVGDYSYNVPSNPIQNRGPTSPAPEIVISSTGGPAYLPPKPVSVPQNSPSSTSYESSTKVAVPSSTPGEPYLPPKIDSPTVSQQPFSPSEKPSSGYITPIIIPKKSPSSAIPKVPAMIPNSYLAPIAPSQTPTNSYVPPSSDTSSSAQNPSNSPSPTKPGNSYIPPSPTAFQVPSATPRPQGISTPAATYLPPYN